MRLNGADEHPVLDGCECDPELIARGLLDLFDRRPPPAGEWSVVYLLFSPFDKQRLWFSAAGAAGAVCRQMAETYRRETELLKTYALEASPAFAWRFELRETAKAGVIELKYPASVEPATVEVVFRPLAEGVEPGALRVATRTQPPLEDGARLLAVAEAATPPTHVAHHVDRFQRGIRWGRPLLYLTESRNSFRVGPHPTCEFVCESLGHVWDVSFEAREGRWLVTRVADDGARRADEPRPSGELKLVDEAAGVRVEGRALSPPPTFAAQMKENRVPVYDLTAVSRLLPLGRYGYVADELRRGLEDDVSSCVRISAGGPFLYLNGAGRVFSVDYGGAEPRPLELGDRVACGEHWTTWEPFAGESGKELASFFRGQLVFDEPLSRRLASREISVMLREAFAGHYDELRGHARLISRDGFNFLLRFAESAGVAPVWVKPGEDDGFRLHASGHAGWKFEFSPVEFVVGTTRFRLTTKGASD
jgi:hypothetical protein